MIALGSSKFTMDEQICADGFRSNVAHCQDSRVADDLITCLLDNPLQCREEMANFVSSDQCTRQEPLHHLTGRDRPHRLHEREVAVLLPTLSLGMSLEEHRDRVHAPRDARQGVGLDYKPVSRTRVPANAHLAREKSTFGPKPRGNCANSASPVEFGQGQGERPWLEHDGRAALGRVATPSLDGTHVAL